MYNTPSFSLIGFRWSYPQIKSNLILTITPPAAIDTFSKGDVVSLDAYVITLPKKPADYYGTNDDFKRNLTLFQDSWRIVHREAVQNNLDVTVTTGVILKSNYPIVVKAMEREFIYS